MQDVQSEVPEVARTLLNGNADQQRRAINTVFLPEGELSHFLVEAKGREEVLAAYQVWTMWSRRVEVTLDRVVVPPEKDLAVLLNFTGGFYPKLWYFPFPMFRLHYDVKLDLVTDENNRTRVRRQEDHTRTEETLCDTLLLRYIWIQGVALRHWIGTFDVFLCKALARVLNRVSPAARKKAVEDPRSAKREF